MKETSRSKDLKVYAIYASGSWRSGLYIVTAETPEKAKTFLQKQEDYHMDHIYSVEELPVHYEGEEALLADNEYME